jgi:hypothetical protein
MPVSDTQIEEEISVNDAIDTLVNEYLNETGINWYDNDGGHGELSINVDEGLISTNVNVCWMGSQKERYSENDIEAGEQVN